MPTGRHRLDRGFSAHRFGRSAALAAVFAAACGDGGATGPSANRAPEPLGAIPDQTVHVGATRRRSTRLPASRTPTGTR